MDTITYGPDGMRTSRSNGTTTWNYVYNGSQLMAMTNRDNTISMYFTYDAAGRPVSVEYNGTVFYYVLNAQGDVIMIVDSNGLSQVTYTYDAWGKHTTPANGLGKYNPLRYRGYVYDTDTGLYYLQSRYYNPEMGRFLNADSYASTGQGILSNNMFAYCRNNPVGMIDPSGELPFFVLTAAIGAVIGAVSGGIVAASNGGDVWAGIGIGAAVGGLTCAGLGAAAGVLFGGSAFATTTAVVSGVGTFSMAVGTGGLGTGLALLGDNLAQSANNASTVLYSGGDAARQAAMDFASNTGGRIIGSTVLGQVANTAASLPGADVRAVWVQASAAFCNQASGVVNAFVSSSAYRGADSILWSVEMSALVNNPRVVEIIIHIFE